MATDRALKRLSGAGMNFEDDDGTPGLILQINSHLHNQLFHKYKVPHSLEPLLHLNKHLMYLFTILQGTVVDDMFIHVCGVD